MPPRRAAPPADEDPDDEDLDDLSDSPASSSTHDPPSRAPDARDAQPEPSHVAGQKRRRVTRACDECRKKKIKCDGKHYECTYDQPSHRRRNPAPQYVASLEARVARFEAIVHTFLPNLDPDDPDIDARLRYPNAADDADPQSSRLGNTNSRQNDASIESMVEATGQLEIDERGNWDYHGHSSGLSFIRRVRDQLGPLQGPEQLDDSSISLPPPRNSRSVSSARSALPAASLKSRSSEHFPSQYMHDSPFDTVDFATEELPSKDLALALCSAALDDACAILNILHQPSFYTRLHRIYGTPQGQLQDEDQKFLPLLYAVLGLGCLFAKDDDSELEREGYRSATGVGYKYFWAARQLMDITDCRDLTSLQAIIFMIMFLQCSSKLATCYAYIGVALRSALRMGLHRSFMGSFNPIEAECRKRAFWTIRKMDIYVGAMLGLPQTLHDDDIDQEYPMAVADDCITSDGILDMAPGSDPPPIEAANANFRLCRIVSKIVRLIYPIKGFQRGVQNPSGAYSVAYTSIKEIERELQQWMESLPSQLVPDNRQEQASPNLVRMQQLLRMAYAHAQLMLYRPFLHFVSTKRQAKNVNARSLACANACISVSRNIIHLTAQMKRQNLLNGSYWFSMYSTFFGILSLVFFTLENPETASAQNVFADAKEGRETLAILAKRSMAADRCTSTLSALFEQIGPVLEKGAKPARSANSSREGLPSNASTVTVAPSSKSSTPKPGASRGKSIKPKKAVEKAVASHRAPAAPSPSMSFSQQRNHNPAVQSMSIDMPTTTKPSSTFGTQSTNAMFNQQQLLHHSQQMPYMTTSYHPYTSNLSDVTAVMFPSDNPFAYPNQPMTTLEQNYAFGRQTNPNEQISAMPTNSSSSLLGTARLPTRGSDEHMSLHAMGSLPSYGSHRQASMGYATNSWGHGIPPTSGAEMWSQHGRSHGMGGMQHLDDVFSGEEWRGEDTEGR